MAAGEPRNAVEEPRERQDSEEAADEVQDASGAHAAESSEQATPEKQSGAPAPGTMQQLLRFRTRAKAGVSQRHISSVKKRMRQSHKRQHAESNRPAAAESSSASAQAAAPADAASKADSGKDAVASVSAESTHTAASLAASSTSPRTESTNAQGGEASNSSIATLYSGLAQPPSRKSTYAGSGRTAEPMAGTEGDAAGLGSMSEVSSSRPGLAVERRRVPGPINAALHAKPAATLADTSRVATARIMESRGWGQRPTGRRCPCMQQTVRRRSVCLLPQRMQAKQTPLAQLRFL